MEDDKLLTLEYQHFSQCFWKNEELGENRVKFYISLVTAIIAALVALASGKVSAISAGQMQAIIASTMLGLLLFGVLTFMRIISRNKVTDEYKSILNYIREQMRKRSVSLDEYQLPFDTSSNYVLGGGLASTVGIINAIIIAALSYRAASAYIDEPWTAALGAFLLSAGIHGMIISKRSSRRREKSQKFRAGAGAIILDSNDRVLVFERSEGKNAWQLPQGGLNVGEEPVEAVFREVFEETGIAQKDLELLSDKPHLSVYELPEQFRSPKVGRGQVHYWFLLRYLGEKESIDLQKSDEFKAFKAVDLAQLPRITVKFREQVYQGIVNFVRSTL